MYIRPVHTLADSESRINSKIVKTTIFNDHPVRELYLRAILGAAFSLKTLFNNSLSSGCLLCYTEGHTGGRRRRRRPQALEPGQGLRQTCQDY